MRFGAGSPALRACNPAFPLPCRPLGAPKRETSQSANTPPPSEKSAMAYSCTAYQLKCNECGKLYGNQPLSACEDCLAPLELTYDLEAARPHFTRANIAAGPISIWRYAALLPVPASSSPTSPSASPPPSVPAISANASAPTTSTSRTTPSASPRSPSRTASSPSPSPTPSASASPPSAAPRPATSPTPSPPRLPASASRPPSSSLPTSNPPRSSTPRSTARASSASTATTTTSTASALRSPDEYNWGFVNVNLRPYYAEGSKTVGYEIAEQLGWRLPDNVVCPMAGGSAHPQDPQGFQRAHRPRPRRRQARPLLRRPGHRLLAHLRRG